MLTERGVGVSRRLLERGASALRSALAAVAVVLTASLAARAQGIDEFGSYGDSQAPGVFAHHFAFELRFGPYLPNVDANVQGTPFRDTFGDDNRYLLGLEIDWQALQLEQVGSLGPGIGWGMTSMSADAMLSDRSGRADQSTSLTLMPMYLVAVARVDVLCRRNIVPLAAYAKAGLGNALWWSRSGGETSEVAGVRAEGSSYGYQFAVGGMLLLDYFNPDTASSMDSGVGVNNSYAFFEWYSSSLDGFGSKDQLQAGTSTWMTGFAVEF